MKTEETCDKDRQRKMINTIKANYRQVEQSIVEQLYMKQDLHGTTVGSAREDIWRQLFEMIIPKKFVIESSVFVIDSFGGVSREVDLAILDEMYTPYIFKYGRIKFIPIEAVAAVVECKSTDLDGKILRQWSKSITDLKTSLWSITRTAGSIAVDEGAPTQKSTRPIRILCALQKSVGPDIKECFDFTLLANSEKRINISHYPPPDHNHLLFWYKDLNLYKYEGKCPIDAQDEATKNKKDILEKTTLDAYRVLDEDKSEVSLLTFNFQFNQLLMLINNPLLFPHRAYVEMFNNHASEKGSVPNG